MHKDILQIKIINENVCDILEKHKLTIIEYNLMSKNIY